MNLLTIATVAGARGVKGEVKLRPADTPPTWLKTVKQVLLTLPGRQQWMTVTQWQWKDPYVLAFFAEIPTREAAADWSKAQVEADETCLPALPDDTYRARDLVGKAVWCELTQQQVAVVDALMFNADEPFLQLKAENRSWLIPFQNRFVPRIDTDRLWIAINLDDLS